MKYVITGGAGNIAKPLATKLLNAGHTVTVVGRSAEHLKPLTDIGAKAAVGSVEDRAFLTKTFAGADAVFTMVPPNFGAKDWKGWIATIGENYAFALSENKIGHVVNLSSIGAHMGSGAGPVDGLHRVEKALNGVEGLSLKHLRPGFFFVNFLANIPMIKNMNILGGNFGDGEQEMILVHTNDIAAAAAEELRSLSFSGSSVRYIASDERKLKEVSFVLGAAVQKPGLPWVSFSDEQTSQGMVQAGLPQEVADNYTEMGEAVRNGKMFEDYYQNRPLTGQCRLEDFAKEFAAVYTNGERAHA